MSDLFERLTGRASQKQIQEYEQQCHELRELIAQKDQDNRIVNDKVFLLQKELEQPRAQRDELESQLLAAQQREAELKAQLVAIQQRKAAVEAQNEELKAKISLVTAQNSNLHSKLKVQQVEKAKKQNRNAQQAAMRIRRNKLRV